MQHHALARLSHTIGLSEAYLLGGRPAEALSRAQAALVASRDQKARAFEAAALRLSGEAQAAEAPPDGQAEWELRQALAIAEELAMRPLAAQCHLGLGRLHRQAGAASRAPRRIWQLTIQMLREMEMWFWLERGEAELSGMR